MLAGNKFYLHIERNIRFLAKTNTICDCPFDGYLIDIWYECLFLMYCIFYVNRELRHQPLWATLSVYLLSPGQILMSYTLHHGITRSDNGMFHQAKRHGQWLVILYISLMPSCPQQIFLAIYCVNFFKCITWHDNFICRFVGKHWIALILEVRALHLLQLVDLTLF